MKRFIICLLALMAVFSLVGCNQEQKKRKYTEYYFDWFDTVTVISGYEESEESFDCVVRELEKIFDKYHKLYNIYLKYEGINNISVINEKKDGEHSVVPVDTEIVELIELSRELYEKTDGNFNIAMGSVLSIWHSYRELGMENPERAELPKREELLAAAEHISMDDVIVDRQAGTVYLADPQMSLDVGAIAKGYACEQAAKYLEENQRTGYVINSGGNVRAVGEKPGGELWLVGIENPNLADTEKPYIAYLELSGEALVTSGSYQRFYTVDGKNYHHIIDPKTLMPSERYLSVSVLCNDSALGDALSTALFNMDYEEGKNLVDTLSDVEAMWVMTDEEIKMSDGFKSYITQVE